MPYHIEDWSSKKPKFNGKRFASYEEARAFISEYADDEALKQHPTDEQAREDLYDGLCEDLYAIEDVAGGNLTMVKAAYSPIQLYLDWFNNYLTLEKQLEHLQEQQQTADEADSLTLEWLQDMHQKGKTELNKQLGVLKS